MIKLLDAFLKMSNFLSQLKFQTRLQIGELRYNIYIYIYILYITNQRLFSRKTDRSYFDELLIIMLELRYIEGNRWIVLETIQVLSNAMGVCVSNFQNTNVTKPYGSTLLALQGGGGVKWPEKKRYERARFNVISITRGGV